MKFPQHPNLHARQHALSEYLCILPDVSERLNALVAHAARQPGLTEEEKIPAHRVTGCVSQVWIVAECEHGLCFFRSAADSSLVAGLVGAVAELCGGLSPAEVLNLELSWLESAGLWSQLSPTRQRGLSAVVETLRNFAASCH